MQRFGIQAFINPEPLNTKSPGSKDFKGLGLQSSVDQAFQDVGCRVVAFRVQAFNPKGTRPRDSGVGFRWFG